MQIAAPMTGSTYRVLVAPGDRVEAGFELVILESMKMEIPVASPSAGTVQEVRVIPGQVVQEGEVVVVLDVLDEA